MLYFDALRFAPCFSLLRAHRHSLHPRRSDGKFVAQQNAEHFAEIIAGWSIITYSVRTAAMFLLAIFVGLFSSAFETISKALKYFGYFTAVVGMLVFVVYWLPSMVLFLIWGMWLLVELRK